MNLAKDIHLVLAFATLLQDFPSAIHTRRELSAETFATASTVLSNNYSPLSDIRARSKCVLAARQPERVDYRIECFGAVIPWRLNTSCRLTT